mmetsp:Transcript_24421/g.84902  ORF Transcript_24421/g.84902 Transcript_24421/m.84902 type:complete len:206 (+) Transcript_24421:1368-1985(+)
MRNGPRSPSCTMCTRFSGLEDRKRRPMAAYRCVTSSIESVSAISRLRAPCWYIGTWFSSLAARLARPRAMSCCTSSLRMPPSATIGGTAPSSVMLIWFSMFSLKLASTPATWHCMSGLLDAAQRSTPGSDPPSTMGRFSRSSRLRCRSVASDSVCSSTDASRMSDSTVFRPPSSKKRILWSGFAARSRIAMAACRRTLGSRTEAR